MKQICVISDSHVNAITSGWELVKDSHPDCNLVFFAAGKDNLRFLEVSSGRLIATDPICVRRMQRSSNGLDSIDGNYDRYLLVGLEFGLFGIHPVMSLCASHRIECEAVDERIPISDECFGRAIEDDLRKSLSVETAVKLHAITDAPIGIIPYPLRALGNAVPRWKARESEIRKLSVDAVNRLSQESRFRLFLQPEHTLSSPLSTNVIYSRVAGSRDGHMNAAYGKEILNMVLDRSPAGFL